MVQEFIRTRGVTVCPPVGSKELGAITIARETAVAEKLKRQWGSGIGPTAKPPSGVSA